MARFNAVPVTEEAVDVLRYGIPDDRIVLKVAPPEGEEGLSASEGFIKTLHRERVEESTFGTKNVSSVCSMEIWYEDEEVEFYFTVPTREEENHYRRQLAGYFFGISITEMIDAQDKFLDVDESQYAAATELSLRNHYFEPISNALGGGDDQSDSDPYKSILNEMDTKDISMRSMIQVVYKPASDKWTSTPVSDVEDYAKEMEDQGVSDPKVFGTRSRSVEDSSAQSATASAIRDRASSQAFHADIRIAVFHESKEEAVQELETLSRLFETVFRERSGQQFVPRKGTGSAETLRKMVERKSDRLYTPNSFRDWVGYNFRTQTDYMVFTVSELASIAHIPSSDDLNVDGIQWTDDPVKGTLPPDAKKFREVTEEEKEQAGEYAGTPEMHKFPSKSGDSR